MGVHRTIEGGELPGMKARRTQRALEDLYTAQNAGVSPETLDAFGGRVNRISKGLDEGIFDTLDRAAQEAVATRQLGGKTLGYSVRVGTDAGDDPNTPDWQKGMGEPIPHSAH